MLSRKLSILLSLAGLFVASLACTINIGGPAYPPTHIPVSTQAAGDLQSAVQTAVAAGAQSGQVTLTITEPQLTSYLAYQLQQQKQALVTDPQVFLNNGQIQVFATASQGYLQAYIEVVVTAGVDAQNQIKLVLASADFGPLPAPASVKDAITAAIQEALTGAIGPAAIGFRLEKIDIASGTLTITGRIK